MRRKEFNIPNEHEIEQFLSKMSFGFLGTVDEDGSPRVTPLNFVFDQGSFFFHGSRVGEKMDHLSADPRVSFTVAEELAIIPSYFTDPNMACPATAYFKSVTTSGTAQIVVDPLEKARVFTLLMNKLQPEGGYDPIDPTDPRYTSRLKGVAMIRITPNHVTAKFKFGQNLAEASMDKVIKGLQERSLLHDEETIELMKKYCPYMP
ncbi:nitroimidazol reductase NimA-like FMN-containing flavoprotein (pyridoxamine 5'-phosphate oxidase superfamily) [Paenibacillus sp. DS2015]|uniref:pyridoxamine 5'-phosphate oxidase family protein n=1 Tax=Paenibacillus sp. DS2015 TaxID=3373917 RepID=UPI003D1F857A